jgi:CYTH domain-containing protein
MAREIERKFLVSGDFKPFVTESNHIRQGYLSFDAKRTVRVRVKDDKGYLTIKGMRSENSISRFEWEKEIPLSEAQELLQLCGSQVIDKIRHLVPYGNHTFEVDEFYGENKGLIVAEIELASEMEAFDRPAWLGKEVTQDHRYYNSLLIQHPYLKW